MCGVMIEFDGIISRGISCDFVGLVKDKFRDKFK